MMMQVKTGLFHIDQLTTSDYSLMLTVSMVWSVKNNTPPVFINFYCNPKYGNKDAQTELKPKLDRILEDGRKNTLIASIEACRTYTELKSSQMREVVKNGMDQLPDTSNISRH